MPSRPSSAQPSATAAAHSRGVTSDSEISSLDLNLSAELLQTGPSRSRVQSSRLRARRGNSRSRSRTSPGLHIDLPPRPQSLHPEASGSSRASEGNTRHRSRPSPGLHIDLPSCPQPLCAEDLQSEAVTSGSTTYQSGHSNLLANRARRQDEMIQANSTIAVLDPLRHTIPPEVRQAVYGTPERTLGLGMGHTENNGQQHQESRIERSSNHGSEQPRSQRSSSVQSNTRSRPLLAGDLYDVGYGYGFEGHTRSRNYSDSSSHRTEPTTTFFEDTIFELRSSSPIYSRKTSTLATRPDIHNSMAPFQGVDPDFAHYQAAELARHAEQTHSQMHTSTPAQTDSSPSLSALSSVIMFDSRGYEF